MGRIAEAELERLKAEVLGNAAAEPLAQKLTAAGIDCFRVLFLKGMDENEYALKMSPSAKALGLAIRNAERMGDVQGGTSVAGGRMPRATHGKALLLTTDAVAGADALERAHGVQESQSC